MVLFVPLVGGALAVIGGMLLERYRVKRSQRREHLRDIQGKVFAPIEQRIKGLFLNLLRRKQSNIELELDQRRRTGAEATEYSWTRRERLKIVQPDPTILEPISDALYNCSKTTHYKDIINEYEILEADFDTYNTWCLDYVQSLADQIKSNLDLPDEPKDVQGPWVRAEALALHIYKRQRDYEPQPVRLRDPRTHPTNTIELPGNSGAIINIAQSEVDKAIELLNRLERNRERVDELINVAASLRKRAIELGQNLERLRYTSVLKGKCELLGE